MRKRGITDGTLVGSLPAVYPEMYSEVAGLCERPVAVRTLVRLQLEMYTVHVPTQCLIRLEVLRTVVARVPTLLGEMNTPTVLPEGAEELKVAAAVLADVRSRIRVCRDEVMPQRDREFECHAAPLADVRPGVGVDGPLVLVPQADPRELLVARSARVRRLTGVPTCVHRHVRPAREPATADRTLEVALCLRQVALQVPVQVARRPERVAALRADLGLGGVGVDVVSLTSLTILERLITLVTGPLFKVILCRDRSSCAAAV